MNATELFHSNGTSTGIFYCDTCRNVARSQHLAEQCCLPNICACGNVVEQKYYTKCAACQRRDSLNKEASKFLAAVKLMEWDGWVYRDGYGNEGFAQTIGELLEQCEDEGEQPPSYVWTCKPNRFAQADMDNIIEDVCEGAYEDFDSGDLVGVDKLRQAVEAFNLNNLHICSYEPDYTTALIITDQEAP